MDIPAFTTGYSEVYGPLFPALFVTIACGAISGFHSLVSSGTTAKQLDNEKDAKPIAYGAMLIESALAIVSLCAVGYIWNQYSAGEITTPTTVFATGIAQMVGTIPGLTSEGVITTVSSLLVLAVLRLLPDLPGYRHPSGSLSCSRSSGWLLVRPKTT